MNEVLRREYILATARELYGRAVYSHKVHEKEREIWNKKACSVKHRNIILVSLTTLLAIVSAAMPTMISTILTAIAATATTAIVLWETNFDAIGKENQNRTAAKELVWIREQFLILIERCDLGTEEPSHLQASLESLTRELTAVYKFAPDTSPGAYAAASASLKGGEFTFTDGEIDSFLPAKLRKTPPLT
jgi:conflict system pore-forming effector with SLATT domain